ARWRSLIQIAPAKPRWPRLQRLMWKGPATVSLLIVRAAGAAVLIATTVLNVSLPGVYGTILLVELAYIYRMHHFLNEAECAITPLLGTLFLCSCTNSKWVAQAGLYFVAGQACLAYFSSGWSKLHSDSWRRGHFLVGLFSRSAYRRPYLAAW